MKIEHVDLDKIKVNDRIRTNQEKVKEMDLLKVSISELGLFHPIALDESYTLIAGFRRLTAYRELRMKDYDTFRTIPAQIFKDVDEYVTLQMELAENEARKNLGSGETKKAKSKLKSLVAKKGDYAVDIEIAKSKEIYQVMHPETVKSANWVGGEKRVLTKEEMVKSGRPDLKISGEPVKTTGAEIKITPKPAPEFAKSLAESMKVSETVVRDRARVGTAILTGKFTEEEVEDYKKGVKSHSKMLEIDREKRRKKILEPLKPKTRYCLECSHATACNCLHCGEGMILCDQKQELIDSDTEVDGCRYF